MTLCCNNFITRQRSWKLLFLDEDKKLWHFIRYEQKTTLPRRKKRVKYWEREIEKLLLSVYTVERKLCPVSKSSANRRRKYLEKKKTMENLGYREGTSKLTKHRRMSRAASLAVDTEGIPLSARCVNHMFKVQLRFNYSLNGDHTYACLRWLLLHFDC